MNKTISIIRIAILLALGSAAFICIIAEPADTASWQADFILSKTCGLGIGCLAYRLYRRWKSDPMISRYERWCEESDTEI